MFLLSLKLRETESLYFMFQYRQVFAYVPGANLRIPLLFVVLNLFEQPSFL